MKRLTRTSGPLRLLYLTGLGLVLGAIVHLVVLFLIPALAERDAWSRLSETAATWSMQRIDRTPDGDALPDLDPAFAVAGCRFDLRQSPLAVTSEGLVPFWSVSIFDRRGRNVYSFNDRTAVDRALNLLVVNPVQMAQLRKNPPEESELAVLIEAPIEDGFVVVRVFGSDASWAERTNAFVAGAQCERYTIAEGPAADIPERTTEDVPPG